MAGKTNTDVPQSLPIVTSRPITRFKVKQVPRVEAKSIEVCYVTQELSKSSNSLRSLGNMCRNDVSMQDSDGWNIKLDQAEIIDMGL